jgi:hypothetical protein
MLEDGFDRMVNIDLSSVVVDAMKKQYHEHLSDRFRCTIGFRPVSDVAVSQYSTEDDEGRAVLTMDARKMTFPDESFDLIVEKGLFFVQVWED